MSDQIKNQQKQLMDPDLIERLEERYETAFPIPRQDLNPDSDLYGEIYTRLCDAVTQLMWPDRYGTDPSDPFMNTSGPARQAANVLMVAAGYPPNR